MSCDIVERAVDPQIMLRSCALVLPGPPKYPKMMMAVVLTQRVHMGHDSGPLSQIKGYMGNYLGSLSKRTGYMGHSFGHFDRSQVGTTPSLVCPHSDESDRAQTRKALGRAFLLCPR